MWSRVIVLFSIVSICWGKNCTAYNKIGFHLGPGGNSDGIEQYIQKLDAAKIPVFVKNVDTYAVLDQVANLSKDVPHVFIYRDTSEDVPNYALDPVAAAQQKWASLMPRIPKGFDKERVWLEVINEPDQNKCDWLGKMGVELASLAKKDGFKISYPGFATGNPQIYPAGPSCWATDGFTEYLKLCAANPDTVAIALHEYALSNSQLMNLYPWLLGRFHFLFEHCDNNTIPRPTVHITEWGWCAEGDGLPNPTEGIQQLDKMMKDVTYPYKDYPTLKGGALWYLGPGFGGIANYAQKYIEPLTEFTLKTRYQYQC